MTFLFEVNLMYIIKAEVQSQKLCQGKIIKIDTCLSNGPIHRHNGMKLCGTCTWMVAGITFCPHLGKVIRGLFHMLYAVRHGTEALVYSDYQRDAAASECLAINSVSGRLAMSWGKSPSTEPLFAGVDEYAPNNPFISSMDCTVFIVLQCYLNDD